jgi:pimeloyl-ACP methyl ester carboxylesterase
VLGQTRLEVLWSDIVNLAAASMQTAALAASAPAAVGSAPAAAAVSAEAARQRVADEIKEALRDRADQHVLATSVRSDGLATAPVAAADLGGLISIPGLNCVDDFSVYLIDDNVRQQILDRFINVVRPQLQAGRELDIIAHSWGTVVAYEGLRQLDADPRLTPQVRNLFTVGAALSIGPVKMRLREANQDGKKPKTVRRWVNLDAQGDIVGGPLKGRPYAVNFDFLNLEPVGCNSLFGLVSPVCAHGSYFDSGNTAVNKDIFARYIDQV